jgi:hypothetical protein
MRSELPSIVMCPLDDGVALDPITWVEVRMIASSVRLAAQPKRPISGNSFGPSGASATIRPSDLMVARLAMAVFYRTGGRGAP